MWGTFEINEGICHVVPVDQDLEILEPHVLEWWCFCNPETYYEDGEEVIIHNQEN